jgi:hypothetical protein
MALSGTVTLTVNVTETKTTGLARLSAPITYSKTFSISDGTGANQASYAYSDTRTLTATSENLDVNGVLSDSVGTTIAATKGKFLLIENTHATANLTVGGAATNGWVTMFGDATDKIVVGPGQVLLLTNLSAAGYGITPATGDLLRVDAGAATVTYTIIILAA